MSTSPRHVVVIGGGVIGTACAYFLSRSGWQVTMIEKNTVGSGSSHGNCGLVCPSHILPLAEPGMVGKALASLVPEELAVRDQVSHGPGLWSWLVTSPCGAITAT